MERLPFFLPCHVISAGILLSYYQYHIKKLQTIWCGEPFLESLTILTENCKI